MSANGFVFQEQGAALRFIGDFDALYRDHDDPWEQSATQGDMAAYYHHSRARVAKAMLRYGVDSALEVGCGHGHLTALLDRQLAGGIIGMDVSPKAVTRARKLHPDCDFLTGDILASDFRPPFLFDAVIWAQCLWYLLHDLDRAVDNTLACISQGGLFVVTQAFLDDQRYGREIIDGFPGATMTLLGRFPGRLVLVESIYDDGTRFCHHDGLLVFRKC